MSTTASAKKAAITTTFLQLQDYYKNKRCLVTGHTGFKGAWLALLLKEMGAKVYGLALEPESDPNLYTVASLPSLLDDECIGDVRDQTLLDNFIKRVKPEIVFHLAAQALVRRSYASPYLTFTTNTLGVVNLLESLRQHPGCQTGVIVTTDKCYENIETKEPYLETAALGGRDPYSASKGAAEVVIAAYKRSFFNTNDSTWIFSARAGNVLGGGDWAEDRIIPDAVRAIENNETVVVRNPKATRPWQHVLEPLTGYLLLGAISAKRCQEFPWYLETTAHAHTFNFAPSESTDLNVGDLVKQFIKTYGRGDFQFAKEQDGAAHEANLLHLDAARATKLLDWHAQLSLKETIHYVARWYQKFYDTKDAAALVKEDIACFYKL